MHTKYAVVLVTSITALACFGCSKAPDQAPASTPVKQDSAHHGNDGWWCDEHGVPEEVCTRCDPALVAKFKAEGDWCQQHDRPDSQCFICHPEREGEFAAQYEAKYGKKPPKPDSEG
jgi:hypothetical protein